MREVEPLLGTGEADVAEPPLLLDALLLDRARVREDALLHADEEHRAELEALRVVERHQRDEAALLARARPGRRRARSAAGTRRGVGFSAARLVLAGDADELHRGSRCVPAPRSSARPRAPRGSRSARARVSRSSGTDSSSAPDMQRLQQRAEPSTALSGAAPTPASSAWSSASKSEMPVRVRVGPQRGRATRRRCRGAAGWRSAASETPSDGLSITCR